MYMYLKILDIFTITNEFLPDMSGSQSSQKLDFVGIRNKTYVVQKGVL